MPYEVESQTTRVGGAVFTSGGGRSSRGNGICGCLGLMLCGGLVCIIYSITCFTGAAVNQRGKDLATFGTAVINWNNGASATYGNAAAPTGAYGGSNVPLTKQETTMTAANYGESSFSDKDSPNNPASYKHIEYKGTTQVGAAGTVTASIGSQSVSATSSRNTGWTTTKRSVEFSTYGGTSYFEGQSGCVDDSFVYRHSNGYYCPNDMVSWYTSSTIYTSWNGFATFAQQLISQNIAYRFTPTTSASGKFRCWDYMDCSCTVEGTTCTMTQNLAGSPQDMSAPMSGGFFDYYDSCASQVWGGICGSGVMATATRVCYTAGGVFYPTPPSSNQLCSTVCQNQGGTWSNSAQAGTVNAYWATQGGQCVASEGLSEVCITSTGGGCAPSGSKSLSKTKYTTSGSATYPATATVTLRTMSQDDPSITGYTLTGCSEVLTGGSASSSAKCFGPTSAELASRGVTFLVLGIVLFCCPFVTLILMCFVCRAILQ